MPQLDVDTAQKLVGLHSPIWLNEALLTQARDEIAKLPLRLELGDKVTALEQIAYICLRANGKV